MAMKKNKIPAPAYQPLLIQVNAMKSHYPHFKAKYNVEGELYFEGDVKASPTMPVYTIKIEYRENKMPRVKILNPPLVEKPPHYFHSLGCLCLYKPANFRWSAAKPISTYIVSWATCWIYFYEVWKERDIWYGPEASHEGEKQTEED